MIRDATSAKFKDLSRQLRTSLLDVSNATTEHWWMNKRYQNSGADAKYIRNDRYAWDALYDTTP
jgi:hypothetical protein